MYQAIVFLPLLGAILAGLIALAGARARFPGGRAPARTTTRTGDGQHARARRDRRRIDHHAARADVARRPCAASSRPRRLAHGRTHHHRLLFVSMILSWIAFVQVGFGHQDARVPMFDLDRLRRPQGRLGAAHRHADRRDAGGGHHRVGARPPLFDRLHGRGPVPAAVLRLSVAVHLRHADAGDGGQPGADVLRLGGRRPRELSADRLLVPQAGGQRRRDQGLRRQPRRRFRLRARHLRACS